ncbi:MAG: ECF transporter S component [Candidatus Izemoplasma sp.]
MRNERVLEITTIGVFSGLIFVMAIVPWLGFIEIGIVSITIIHIPVLIGGIFGGKRVSLALGLAFGLSSLMIAFLRPTLPASFVFQNPLVSVLPRVLFGYFLYIIYKISIKTIPNEFTAMVVAFVTSTLVHTVLVLVPMYIIFVDSDIFSGMFGWIWGIMLTNGFFEAILAGLVGAPIAYRLKVYLKNMGR